MASTSTAEANSLDAMARNRASVRVPGSGRGSAQKCTGIASTESSQPLAWSDSLDVCDSLSVTHLGLIVQPG